MGYFLWNAFYWLFFVLSYFTFMYQCVDIQSKNTAAFVPLLDKL